MFYDDDCKEAEIINHINRAKSLYDLQVYKVENEEYIKNLLHEDYVNAVKRNFSWYEASDFIIGKAQEELISKRKKKREHLELLTLRIKTDFLNNDDNFEFIKIMSCGYDGYSWSFRFTGYDQTFEICTPVLKNITTRNFSDANNGMFTFAVEERQGVWKTLKASYRIKDIAEFIKEYFQLKETEKA